MEVTIPTGSVAPSDISLEMIEAASISALPTMEDPIIKNLWSSPKSSLAQSGEINPTNATVPINATAEATRTELTVKTNILN